MVVKSAFNLVDFYFKLFNNRVSNETRTIKMYDELSAPEVKAANSLLYSFNGTTVNPCEQDLKVFTVTSDQIPTVLAVMTLRLSKVSFSLGRSPVFMRIEHLVSAHEDPPLIRALVGAGEAYATQDDFQCNQLSANIDGGFKSRLLEQAGYIVINGIAVKELTEPNLQATN